MGFVEDGSANLRKRDHIFGCVDIPHGGLTRSIVPAKGLRFGKAGVATRPKTCFVSLLRGRRRGVECCSVGEHPVQDHREFARQRDLGLVHAGSPGDPHRPAFEFRAVPDRLRQHDVSGLAERLAHRGVADLADPPGAVGLAGLILLRCQSEVRARSFGRFEPRRPPVRSWLFGLKRRQSRSFARP